MKWAAFLSAKWLPVTPLALVIEGPAAAYPQAVRAAAKHFRVTEAEVMVVQTGDRAVASIFLGDPS